MFHLASEEAAILDYLDHIKESRLPLTLRS